MMQAYISDPFLPIKLTYHYIWLLF